MSGYGYPNVDTATLNAQSATVNGGSTPSAPEPVLNLTRVGTNNQSWSNFATFYLSRYENAGTANVGARTQLDLSLTHDTLVQNTDTSTKVLRLRSDGTVSIPGNAEASSATTGALQVGGGVGIGRALVVIGTSSFTGLSTFIGGLASGSVSILPSSTSTVYGLTLPPALPTKNNQALLTSTTGALKWGDLGTDAVNSYLSPADVVSTATPVANLVANSYYLSKDVYVSTVGSEGTYPALYNLRSFKTPTGYSEPAVTSIYDDAVGAPGVTFSIDPTGQVFFTKTGSTPGWVSTTFSWVTPSLQTKLYTAVGTLSGGDVTGLAYSDRPLIVVDLYVKVTTSTPAEMNGMYTIKAYKTATVWVVSWESVSTDDLGFTFSVNQVNGQVQYVHPATADWVSTTFSWVGAASL